MKRFKNHLIALMIAAVCVTGVWAQNGSKKGVNGGVAVTLSSTLNTQVTASVAIEKGSRSLSCPDLVASGGASQGYDCGSGGGWRTYAYSISVTDEVSLETVACSGTAAVGEGVNCQGVNSVITLAVVAN
jgi:hypothetical protein